MTSCPWCNEGLKCVSTSAAQTRVFYCDSIVDRNGSSQSERCRIRQLEQALLQILPLAQQASCMHDTELSDANDCCMWAAVAKSIESLGIEPKQPAQASAPA